MALGENLIVGLTGGMGCGKSTAAALFAELGFRRLDADQVVRDELLTDPEVIELIKGKFGTGVLDQQGRVARDRLGAIVFAERSELQWLEKLLHPRLRARWKNIISQAKGEKFIVEVPLLFENGMENWFDFTVCVATDSALQLQRLEKRGIPPDLARQRLARQWPLARKCELADFVLLNDGTPAFLREQINLLVQQFCSPQSS